MYIGDTMDFRNCQKCNKVFNHIRGPILCSDCDREIFNEIKNYFNEHVNANIQQVSLDLDIPLKIIREYIKDDRIMELRSDNVNLCRLCGDVVLDDNRYCPECLKKAKLISGLDNSVGTQNSNSPKMHYFNKEKRR